MRIIVKSLDIEVRIRCHEIEDIILGIAEPVLPADIPSLDKQLVEAVRCSEIDVAAHIVIIRAVPSARLC